MSVVGEALKTRKSRIDKHSIKDKILMVIRRVCVLWFLLACCSERQEVLLPDMLGNTIPWNIKRLSNAPYFDWIDQSDSVWSLKYQGEEFNNNVTQVFAYYASPSTLIKETTLSRKYPGIVLVHGGGGTAFRVWALEWAKRGYAAIAMDLGGVQPAPMSEQTHLWGTKTLPFEKGGVDQWDGRKFFNIENDFNEQWQFHAVSNVIRAHSLLRSFHEVDAKKTAITGISWGGYLTELVVGTDHRFKAAVPVYGCGFLQESSDWLQQFDSLGTERIQKWVTLWDPSQYVSSIKTPTLFINGTNDFTYHAESWIKTTNLMDENVRRLLIPYLHHSQRAGFEVAEVQHFIEHHLNGESLNADFSNIKKKGNYLVGMLTTPDAFQSVQLIYTVEDKPNKEREWKSEAAKFKKNSSIAKLPKTARLAYFLGIDKEGFRVSSPVYVQENED